LPRFVVFVNFYIVFYSIKSYDDDDDDDDDDISGVCFPDNVPWCIQSEVIARTLWGCNCDNKRIIKTIYNCQIIAKIKVSEVLGHIVVYVINVDFWGFLTVKCSFSIKI